ncbi:MAG TPA: 1-acyl-sn-glycerol-3-phosphate acyltransferase [Gemmatimonadaceae bacterium]|nr:1-acyl-sn-glycerol-3-phosphate acyltransferase [Gemmatimonadaceae bacterium]
MPWVLGAVLVVVALALAWRLTRRWADRAAARSVLRFRARVDRFKFTRKSYVRAELLTDEEVADAVLAHAAEHALPEAAVWRRVEQYVDEIVPFFNLLAYYRVGYWVSRTLLDLLYKVSVEYERPPAVARIPRDSIVIYLANHRSNADYVLVGYVLSGQVAISYAVGEWARAFPLEYIFKSFGSYFVRRGYREPLYHTVLERYVQLITRNGVTQGIFPEGGLTRDGRLQPGKIGLLDYMIGVARDASFRDRLYLVPVSVNYDRVLEDRSLLRELAAREGRGRPSRLAQLAEVTHYVAWNVGRLLTGRWQRYGRAAVTIGEPMPLAPWFAEQGGDLLFTLPRRERLARVQALCDRVMSRIGALIPVTPVPLACAAIQSLGAPYISRRALLARMEEMRDVLVELNGRVIRADRSVSDTFDRAWRMLRMRRILLPADGDGFVVPERNRELVSYYANSIAHVLGPFEEGVRARDALPVERALG